MKRPPAAPPAYLERPSTPAEIAAQERQVTRALRERVGMDEVERDVAVLQDQVRGLEVQIRDLDLRIQSPQECPDCGRVVGSAAWRLIHGD